jgi:hypothetical protein
MSRLEPDVACYLEDRLGRAHPNSEFARAVTLHLGSVGLEGWSQQAVARQVVELLEPGYNTLDAEALARMPELVASLFQNADLLTPDDPRSHVVAALVMEAIERLVDG